MVLGRRVLAVLVMVVILGCGGRGLIDPERIDRPSGGGSLAVTPIDGQVVPPSASAIDVAALDVWTSIGASRPDTGGSVAISIFDGGPQYADVRDAEDRLVFAGYVSTSQTRLDAASTAEALIFVALGGLTQIDEAAPSMLAGVRDLEGFDDAVAAVSAQLVDLGYIDLSQGGVKAAIDAVADPLLGRVGGFGAIAEPTNASGLILDTLVDGELKVTNTFLRRVKAYLQRTGYTTADGVRIEEAGPEVELDIPTPDRYAGFTDAIGDIASGNLSWTPVTGGPYAIPLTPEDATATHYRLTAIGLGAGAGDFNALTDAQARDYPLLALESIVRDLILPPLVNIALPLKPGIVKDFFGNPALLPVIRDLVNDLNETAPEVIADLNQGDWRGALTTLWNSGWTSATAMPALVAAMAVFLESRGIDDIDDQLPKAGQRLRALGFVDVFFASADMAILANDLSKSDRANIFEITVTEGVVTLIPGAPAVCADDSLMVEAVIQNRVDGAPYEFVWTVGGGFRLESERGGMDQNGTLVTSDDTVKVTAETPGVAVIGVSVRRTDPGSQADVGDDAISIEFVGETTFEPDTPTIQSGESITVTADFPGEGTPRFRYTLESPIVGSIDRSGIVDENTFTFTHTSGPGVTQLIKVETFYRINGEDVLVCTDFATIEVAGEAQRYDLVFDSLAESYEDIRGDTKWVGYVSAYLVVPRMKDVVSYEFYYKDSNSLREVFFADKGPEIFQIQQAKNPANDPYWVPIRTYFLADLDSEAEAIDWINGGLGDGMLRLRRELEGDWYTLRTTQ